MRMFYVYIMSSKRNGTVYIGITNNLAKRIYEHKNKKFRGFSAKYNVCNLVYYEAYDSITTTIKREKQLKAWKRNWKIQLIEKTNPGWECLYLQHHLP